MRVWDIPVEKLCNKHLLGQHREIHAIYSMITENKGGSYQKHPEVLRWSNKLPALTWAHRLTWKEMQKRGMKHQSNVSVLMHYWHKPTQWQTTEQQIAILKAKRCDCKI